MGTSRHRVLLPLACPLHLSLSVAYVGRRRESRSPGCGPAEHHPGVLITGGPPAPALQTCRSPREPADGSRPRGAALLSLLSLLPAPFFRPRGTRLALRRAASGYGRVATRTLLVPISRKGTVRLQEGRGPAGGRKQARWEGGETPPVASKGVHRAAPGLPVTQEVNRVPRMEISLLEWKFLTCFHFFF